jgi:hypothetical protein
MSDHPRLAEPSLELRDEFFAAIILRKVTEHGDLSRHLMTSRHMSGSSQITEKG